MWLFRVFSSAIFLAIIVSSIPLAFDVGGRTCGLAFSLSLASFYFLFSLLRLTTPSSSWLRSSFITVIRFTQWIIIPTLLIWSLNRFSVDADYNGGSWVERTFGGRRVQDDSIYEWLFGRDGLVETVTLGNWDRLLRWSTPVFQLAEGFCSLLVIQAAGQITRWLVNRGGRSDSWMVNSLLILQSTIARTHPVLDRSLGPLGYGYLQLRVFPLARSPVSRDIKRGCRVDRRFRHLRGHPMRLGNWQWTWKPGRELLALRLHRPLHLSDIYRLSAILSCGADSFSLPSWRSSSSATYNHGIVHYAHARSIPAANYYPRNI